MVISSKGISNLIAINNVSCIYRRLNAISHTCICYMRSTCLYAKIGFTWESAKKFKVNKKESKQEVGRTIIGFVFAYCIGNGNYGVVC